MTTIDAKKVQGRRSVHYDSWDEMLHDAETLAGSNTRTLGNWTFAQILSHIAMSLNTSIDGAGFSFPRPAQWLMSLLMKRRFLTKPVPPGFKTTKELTAPDTLPLEKAMEQLRAAITRQETETTRAPHPGFGELTPEEHSIFHLRHAELHMSYVVPE